MKDIGEFISTWGGVLAVIVNALVLWVAWSVRKQFVSQDQLAEHIQDHDKVHAALGKRLGDGEKQFARIESELDHLPTREDIDRIETSMGELKATMAGVREAVNGLQTAVVGMRDLVMVLNSHELAEARLVKAGKNGGKE